MSYFLASPSPSFTPTSTGPIYIYEGKTQNYSVADHNPSFLPPNSTYKAVAGQVAKSGYRPDLREAAVSRVSAIRQSQKEPKPAPEPKLRGKKAKKATEASA